MDRQSLAVETAFTEASDIFIELGVPPDPSPSTSVAFDEAAAGNLFETKCSQCHGLDRVENHEFANRSDVEVIVRRMVNNGLTADQDELLLLMHYLEKRFVTSADPEQRSLRN